MIVRFWGVHGSLPRPGPKTLKFGGNTSCVEIICGENILIFDAGSGIRELGEDLVKRGIAHGSLVAHIFFSHYHWDHIQGFPFFDPAFIQGNRLQLYGACNDESGVRCAMESQMSQPCFPVKLEELKADIEFHTLRSGDRTRIGEAYVMAKELQHPGGSLGYRIECEGKAVVYASDTEYDENLDHELVELAQSADLLIHDSMFTPEQYTGESDGIPKQDWGHSTWQTPVRVAMAANVGRLALFHHGNEDAVVEDIQDMARKLFPKTIAAYEGLEIKL
jgi:phosphoribosyl 1,2-cyclic phosphodiesterase